MILIIYISISLIMLIFLYKIANRFKNNGLISFALAIVFAILGGTYLSIGNQNFNYLIKIGLYKENINYVDYFTLFMIVSIIFISIYKLAMKK